MKLSKECIFTCMLARLFKTKKIQQIMLGNQLTFSRMQQNFSEMTSSIKGSSGCLALTSLSPGRNRH